MNMNALDAYNKTKEIMDEKNGVNELLRRCEEEISTAISNGIFQCTCKFHEDECDLIMIKSVIEKLQKNSFICNSEKTEDDWTQLPIYKININWDFSSLK